MFKKDNEQLRDNTVRDSIELVLNRYMALKQAVEVFLSPPTASNPRDIDEEMQARRKILEITYKSGEEAIKKMAEKALKNLF